MSEKYWLEVFKVNNILEDDKDYKEVLGYKTNLPSELFNFFSFETEKIKTTEHPREFGSYVAKLLTRLILKGDQEFTFEISTIPIMRMQTAKIAEQGTATNEFCLNPLTSKEFDELHSEYLLKRIEFLRSIRSHKIQKKMFNPFGQGDFR